MNVLEMNEIGKFIRKTRKERGLRLEDLSDDHISTATISNIERGIPHVNKDKILYLMSKLGLELDEIPQMLEKESESLESVHLKFTAIETMIEVGSYQEAIRSLSNISEESLSLHQATVHLIKGRCFLEGREWRKGERELSEAIRLSFQDPYSNQMNLEAVSYLYLSKSRAQQRDWAQALQYVERGIELYQQSQDTKQIIYHLLVNQVIYLDQLGRTDEALRKLEELWTEISLIQNKDLVIQMYRLRVDLYQRIHLHHDAVRYAKEGIQLAIKSHYHDELFRLWLSLGKTYLDLTEYDDAETCLHFVMSMSGLISDSKEWLKAKSLLGQLYFHQEKWDKARETLQAVIDQADKSQDAEIAGQALLLMGKLLKQREHWVDAIQVFIRLTEVASKSRAYALAYKGFDELASCYEQIGQMDSFRSAVEQMYQTQQKIKMRQQRQSLRLLNRGMGSPFK
ncbi:helix-turn-helix domain-containing protein [Hazenella coriacea]|uniref:Tetratricopeptide repeat protein n=1 Tax=Hazenella coriacea TaxID=1179467 RepID=A0A4V2UVH6_9BACL|nr:tetratricopeptide repeat protein [Hazenella coriacea]TCS95817.1 tetratricopeptide repeat protein [Hazenella coriacea]